MKDEIVGDIVLKLGASGAILITRDGAVFRTSPPNVDVVDTVGAGDGLAAAYLAAFLENAEPTLRLHRGVTAGALVCSAPGDWEGLPRAEDLRTVTASEPVER